MWGGRAWLLPLCPPSPQILEKKKWVLTHLVYSQMEGAVVNYLQPFLGPRGALGWGKHRQSGRTAWEASAPVYFCPPKSSHSPRTGAAKQQEAREKFAENGTYQTKQAFAEGLRFILGRGCLCFLFLEIGWIPLIQRGRKQDFCWERGEGRKASTLILQPSFLIRNQPKESKNQKKPPLPTALPAIRERSAAKVCAWGFAFPKLFILLEHRSHLEEFRQAEVSYCLCCSDESQSTRRSRQPGSQGPCSSLVLTWEEDVFSMAGSWYHPPRFPLASPILWHIFHFKPNPLPSPPPSQHLRCPKRGSESRSGSWCSCRWIKGKPPTSVSAWLQIYFRQLVFGGRTDTYCFPHPGQRMDNPAAVP